MSILKHNYDGLDEPAGPYVHAVSHQNTLYTSGLTAFGTHAERGNICDQARSIFEQLELITKQHSTSLQQLIKVTVFVTDLTDIGLLRNCLFDVYGDHLPASSLIKIESLFSPELLIEIEAMIAI